MEKSKLLKIQGQYIFQNTHPSWRKKNGILGALQNTHPFNVGKNMGYIIKHNKSFEQVFASI
jgi:hypothetical protein